MLLLNAYGLKKKKPSPYEGLISLQLAVPHNWFLSTQNSNLTGHPFFSLCYVFQLQFITNTKIW